MSIQNPYCKECKYFRQISDDSFTCSKYNLKMQPLSRTELKYGCWEQNQKKYRDTKLKPKKRSRFSKKYIIIGLIFLSLLLLSFLGYIKLDKINFFGLEFSIPGKSIPNKVKGILEIGNGNGIIRFIPGNPTSTIEFDSFDQ